MIRLFQLEALTCLFLISSFVYAEENSSDIAIFVTRGDSIPSEVESASDAYFEGYVQSLIDMHYSEYRVIVISKEKRIWLANLPKNELLSKSIISFV